MFRVIFWSLVAAFVGVVLWVSAHPNELTPRQNIIFWTSMVDIVMVFFVAYGAGMLVRGVKHQSVILGGRYGAKEFYRDSQPVRYWLIMAGYVGWVLLILCALYIRNLELVRGP